FHRKQDHRKPGVVLFTSGTEGEPKGVVLSHHNIIANVEQVRSHIGLSPEHDSVFNPLPTFHCFGLTVGAILPLVAGVRAVFHPSPLQPREIAGRIESEQATILLATDTFISQYARVAKEGALDSVRLAVCGAERVRDETRKFVRQKFNIEILEGYGATEAAPVVAANSLELNKPGTVGRLLSDMEYDLVPVEGIEEGGKLRIRGPNVMVGYMRSSAPGIIEAPTEGWHDTGDIVVIDEDDCIRIKGRVKRFAKIGGEMVSLAVVENCASAIWPDDMHAAAAIPDPRKGEQVVLISTAKDVNREEILAWAQSHGVSELSVPRKVFHVDEVPVLGTGKVDYGTVGKTVSQLTEMV
ncbi:MAG: AMP-binding protein, partial [Pseudomonadota bacterium]